MGRVAVLVLVLAFVAGLVGFYFVRRASDEAELVRAAAAKLGVPEKELAEAGDLIERLRKSDSISQADLEAAERLLASEHSQLRRLGLTALEFGIGKTNPERVTAEAKKLLLDTDPRLRAAALSTLYAVDRPNWDHYSATMGKDPEKGVRNTVEYYDLRHRTDGKVEPPSS